MTHSTPAPVLKPCPFCGGKPDGPKRGSESDERSGYNFKILIRCTSCGATIETNSHQGPGGWCDDKGEAKEAAIAAWNLRAFAAKDQLHAFAKHATTQQVAEPTSEDTAMLDWLESRCHRGIGDGMNPRAVRLDFFHAWPGMHATTLPLPTIRDAIRAAMTPPASTSADLGGEHG